MKKVNTIYIKSAKNKRREEDNIIMEDEIILDDLSFNEILRQAVKNVLLGEQYNKGELNFTQSLFNVDTSKKDIIHKKEKPKNIYRKDPSRGNRDKETVIDYESIIIKESYNSINFIDNNDVFVGFDYYRSCCEDFGWYLSRKIDNNKYLNRRILKGYFFDTKYIKYNEEHSKVYFKLIHETKRPIYLTLFNEHNGYYAHDFFMKKQDKTIVDSCL